MNDYNDNMLDYIVELANRMYEDRVNRLASELVIDDYYIPKKVNISDLFCTDNVLDTDNILNNKRGQLCIKVHERIEKQNQFHLH